MTTIQEARDLSTLKIEELVGSLMTYEINLNQHEEKELKKTYASWRMMMRYVLLFMMI